ncbi:MAG: hypothetical protein DMG82_20525 [Acidobacteria bacterium]|nr:MAG: hypothetical protein DMG82_20525 [Acidobacteriota bacterium]
MPVQHFVDAGNRLVITKCSGAVSRAEVVTSMEELSSQPDFRCDFRQLVDLSRVSKLNVGFNDIEAIHRLCDPFSNEGKRAVIAPGHGAIFGLARMYQLLVDHENFQVFQTIHEAIVWLGLEFAIVNVSIRKADFTPNQQLPRKRARGASEK